MEEQQTPSEMSLSQQESHRKECSLLATWEGPQSPNKPTNPTWRFQNSRSSVISCVKDKRMHKILPTKSELPIAKDDSGVLMEVPAL
jgi:hypothetical protein